MICRGRTTRQRKVEGKRKRNQKWSPANTPMARTDEMQKEEKRGGKKKKKKKRKMVTSEHTHSEDGRNAKGPQVTQ